MQTRGELPEVHFGKDVGTLMFNLHGVVRQIDLSFESLVKCAGQIM